MTNKYSYLLCHGFCFTHDYWRNLVPLLGGNIAYFDENFVYDGRPYIGIGHSLGFQKLNNSNVKFDYLVGLQGFTNFCGTESELHKTREDNINRMKKTFEADAVGSLRMFYNACGYKGPIPSVDSENLIFELQSMKNKYKCSHDCPILIIGSNDDEILPPEILDDNFNHVSNAKIKKINGVSHLLGFKKPEYVAKEIFYWIETLKY
ncbi:MAG: alpha/beta hydrolase [Holosporales bacterium]|jgi:pimeloyl-[acyl-carrier protein] methyl ester esterase|nr:alpha/beta hydrolase [Holosporales bacterium]